MHLMILLLLLLLFSLLGIGAAKAIEATIDPSKPTSFWFYRFASLGDLLGRFQSFKYSESTSFIILIPSNSLVRLDQNYTFGEGQNVEIIFQGADRLTSRLDFSEKSQIIMNKINLTLAGLTLTGGNRTEAACFLCVT